MTLSAINIRRESPSQRRHYRLAVPLIVTIEGVEYKTIDWSMGGCLIGDYHGAEGAGDEVKATVGITFQGFDINFEVQSRVVWIDRVRARMALEFFHLEENKRELLQFFSRCLVAGEMQSIEGAIRHLDIPVTPVSDRPDQPATGKVIEMRKLRSRMTAGFYLVLGLVLSVYIGRTIYANVFTYRIDSAVLNGPDRMVESPVTGVLENWYVQEGGSVESKQPLAFIRDDEIIERIELARFAIKDASADLSEKQARLASQKRKLESYRKIGLDKVDIATSRVKVLEQQVELARKRRDRFAALESTGVISTNVFDETEEHYVQLQGQLEAAMAEHSISVRAVLETDQGRFFTDHKLEGEVAELQSAVESAAQRLEVEQQKLDLLEQRKPRMVTLSPIDGRVSQVYGMAGQTVSKGQPLALVQGAGARVIEAYISSTELAQVRIGQSARIRVPTNDEVFDAKVTRVELNALIPDELRRTQAGSHLSELLRTARVVLEFDEPSSVEDFPSRLPASVELQRMTGGLVGTMMSGVAAFFTGASANADHPAQ